MFLGVRKKEGGHVLLAMAMGRKEMKEIARTKSVYRERVKGIYYILDSIIAAGT